jgi:hypothetical protein
LAARRSAVSWAQRDSNTEWAGDHFIQNRDTVKFTRHLLFVI